MWFWYFSNRSTSCPMLRGRPLTVPHFRNCQPSNRFHEDERDAQLDVELETSKIVRFEPSAPARASAVSSAARRAVGATRSTTRRAIRSAMPILVVSGPNAPGIIEFSQADEGLKRDNRESLSFFQANEVL